MTSSVLSKAQTPIKGSAKKCARRTSRRKTHTKPGHHPGLANRKAAKPLDSGARGEVAAQQRLVSLSCYLDAWRLPGIKQVKVSGVGTRPDMAAYMRELEGLAVECSPDVKDKRPDYNVIIEVKTQHSTGSADQKIPTAIVDMAHLSDATGAIGFIILDVPVLPAETVQGFKHLGREHSVVVLTLAECNRWVLRREAMRVARQRLKFANLLGPRGGVRVPAGRTLQTHEMAFVLRWTARRKSSQKLPKLGVAALSK